MFVQMHEDIKEGRYQFHAFPFPIFFPCAHGPDITAISFF